MSSSTWNCSLCTFENQSSSTSCAICTFSRPTSSSASAKTWKCAFCTVLNSNEWRFCVECGAESLPGQTLSPQPQQQQQQRDNQIGLRILEQKDQIPDILLLRPPPAAARRTPQPLSASLILRNQHVTGCLHDNSFQTSVVLLNGSVEEDPLLIPLFSGLHCHAIPQLGIYGPYYQIFDTIGLIKLPADQPSLARTLPPDLYSALLRGAPTAAKTPQRWPWENTEYYVMIHQLPLQEEEKSFPMTVNVVPHPWVFANMTLEYDVQMDAEVSMGIFQPFNVSPIGEVGEDLLNFGGPIRFGDLGRRSITMHNGSFSPNNAQFLLPKAQLSCFFLSCYHNARSSLQTEISGVEFEEKGSISFHVILGEEQLNHLKPVLETASDLQTLMEGILDCPMLSMLHLQLRRHVFNGTVSFEQYRNKSGSQFF